jgi:hypothetical protein
VKTCHESKAGDSVLLSPLIGLNIMLATFLLSTSASLPLPACLPACLLIANYLDPNYWRLVGWFATFWLAWDDVQLLRFLSTIQIMTEISGFISVQNIQLLSKLMRVNFAPICQ